MTATPKDKSRITISLPKDTYEAIQKDAERKGISMNAWLNIAAAEKLSENQHKNGRKQKPVPQ